MCGIFGCILWDGLAVDKIVDGLKRLEYRGYDSVGVALIDGGVLGVRKDQGKLEEVVDKLGIRSMRGHIGIGHTRWATHGAPSMVNAHPHLDGSGRIAVIHNGVIENYIGLKEELLKKGHSFVSRTDTEVIPHLIQEELGGGDVVWARLFYGLCSGLGAPTPSWWPAAWSQRSWCAPVTRVPSS